MESKRLLYDMKDKQYKDKALRRQLWEGKAAEYGVDYNSIQKWYHTQRTRFSKLREGQPRKQSHKRSGAGLSSDEGEDPIIDVEASEHDSDRDRFIRRIFNFLRPHIKRQKKDTPASFKDKLSLAETGELAGSDDSTITGSLTDETKEPTKKYTGYPTPRPSSRSRKEAKNRPGSPSMQMKVTGASLELQDRLVQFITREQQVSRATPFCKYLETELDRLHEACLDPAYEEITTVLNHYRKMSKQFRMREADGERISPLEDVPSAFQSKQQRPVTVAPVSASAIHPRVSQLQQESSLSSGASYSVSRAVSSPSDFQPSPRYWPLNPPPASVWRSQECGYVEQANQQYNLEQLLHSNVPISASTHGYLHSPRRPVFTQLHSQHPQQPIGDTWQLNSMQPVQNPRLPLVSSQQSQYNVSKDGSANIDKDDPSALETNDDNNNTSQ